MKLYTISAEYTDTPNHHLATDYYRSERQARLAGRDILREAGKGMVTVQCWNVTPRGRQRLDNGDMPAVHA